MLRRSLFASNRHLFVAVNVVKPDAPVVRHVPDLSPVNVVEWNRPHFTGTTIPANNCHQFRCLPRRDVHQVASLPQIQVRPPAAIITGRDRHNDNGLFFPALNRASNVMPQSLMRICECFLHRCKATRAASLVETSAP